jgi:hypothetical protein
MIAESKHKLCPHCGELLELATPVSAHSGNTGTALFVCLYGCRRETPVLHSDAITYGLAQLKAA